MWHITWSHMSKSSRIVDSRTVVLYLFDRSKILYQTLYFLKDYLKLWRLVYMTKSKRKRTKLLFEWNYSWRKKKRFARPKIVTKSDLETSRMSTDVQGALGVCCLGETCTCRMYMHMETCRKRYVTNAYVGRLVESESLFPHISLFFRFRRAGKRLNWSK